MMERRFSPSFQPDSEQIQNIHDALWSAQNELTSATWSKNFEACDRSGRELPIDHPDAYQFCAFGIVIKYILPAAEISDLKYIREILDQSVLEYSNKKHSDIFTYNNDRDTNFVDIQLVMSRARMKISLDTPQADSIS